MKGRNTATRTRARTQVNVESKSTVRPVIVLTTRTVTPETLNADPDFRTLSRRFDILLADSLPDVQNLSRDLRSAGNQVVLLLSDTLTRGDEVISFVSDFSQQWPEAGFHLFDTMEGRVIFTEPPDPDSNQPPAIRIESNGREALSGRLVHRMVERYFPHISPQHKP